MPFHVVASVAATAGAATDVNTTTGPLRVNLFNLT